MGFCPSKSALRIVPHFRNLFLLGMLTACVSVLFLVFYADLMFQNNKVYFERYHSMEYYLDNSSTIRTEGCRIPFIAADKYFYQKFGTNGAASPLKPCPPNPLLGSNKSHIWIENSHLHFYNLSTSSKLLCCYKSFYRPTSAYNITAQSIDSRVKYKRCRTFTNTITVHDEFVRVICGDASVKKVLFDTFFVFPQNKILVTKPYKKISYNILILGIDAVSRLNLHRTMPETVNILKKLGAVELLGYNKVGDNTFPNLIPLLMGIKDTELKETCWPNISSTFDNCPFIWKRFQQNGFTTALAEDTSWLGTFNYLKSGFKASPTDYYLHTFINEAERFAGTNRDGNSNLCMNEKFFFKILLDYIEDLTTSLTSKLFGFFWETTMSHDFLKYPSFMDDSYRQLFSKMHTSGYLNETIIFLMSDHGMRWGKFRLTKQGFIEDRLPFLIALMPHSFRDNFNEAYSNLKRNSRRLTTPFDMFETLSDLINLNNIENTEISTRSQEHYSSNRGISLFLPIPGNRTCKSAAIDDHWCTCYRYAKIEYNSLLAKKAVKQVVSHLNGLLERSPQCAELTVAAVLEVTRLLPGNFKEHGKDFLQLTVVVKTNPGGGIFEATIGREGGRGGNWTLAGSVSRLNLYGNQSYCAPTSELKLYCFCINSTLTTTTENTLVS